MSTDHPNGGESFAAVPFTLGDGSRIGIARVGDHYALHVEPGVATDTVFLDRGELRELALRLVDATQQEELK
jgi:hypothetical protein